MSRKKVQKESASQVKLWPDCTSLVRKFKDDLSKSNGFPVSMNTAANMAISRYFGSQNGKPK